MRTTLTIPARLNCEEIPSHIEMMGDVNLIAADVSVSKKPELQLLMNTGTPMKVGGFRHPVIVNIKGARFDKKKTPIIMDHDVNKRLGYATSQSIDTKKFSIEASGTVLSNTQLAKDFIADAKDGFPFQTSIGATILEGEMIDEGESATVNGQSWDGPVIVANRTLIRELTVTVLGADKETSAKIAAKAKTSTVERKNRMDFEAFVASLGLEASELSDAQTKKLKAKHAEWKRLEGLNASDDDDEEEEGGVATKRKVKGRKVKAGRKTKKSDDEDEIEASDDDDDDDTDLSASARMRAADEEERRDGIRQLHARYADDLDDDATFKVKKKELTLNEFKAHAIRDGWTVDAFELQLMKASRPEVRTNPSIQTIGRDIEQKALECALLRYSGVADNHKNDITGKQCGLDAMYDDKVLEASWKKQYNVGGSIQALLDLQIRAAGKQFTGSNRHGSDFIGTAIEAWEAVKDMPIKASGFSTLNITNLLENVMNKSALAAFQAAENVWSFVTNRIPLNDFKPAALYKLDWSGTFKKVATDGELKHVSMVDSKKTIQADTFGAMVTIDRKTIRNDDLGMVLSLARSLGSLGAFRIEESVFVLLLSNPSSFFHANNGNLITGAGTALSLAALETARQSFRNQVINGKPVSVSPSILLVGTTNETLANQLYRDENLAITTTADTGKFYSNPNKGLYKPYVTPYLNNTSITDQDGNAISGQSSTQWYLSANPKAPQGAALNIGFLDGRETPYFDEADTQFNIPGGLQFRSYLDWGVAMHITQLMLKSAGA